MTNWEVYNLCQYILNEEESGNALTPADFDRLLKICSTEMMRNLCKDYEEGQEITDSLKRFKSVAPLTFDTNGQSTTLPANYYRKSFLMFGPPGSKIWTEFVTDYDFAFRENRYLDGPTARHPYARFTNDGVGNNILEIRPIPSAITSGAFNYLRRPNEPVFDYYYDSNGRIVPLVGTPLDFEREEILGIVGMIVEKAGANLKAGDVISYAEKFKADQK